MGPLSIASTPSMTSESPFSNYLTTNHAPSNAEVDGIGALIADRKEAARGISARLESLAKEAQALQDQLKQHTHYIKEHKTLDRLGPSTTSEIV